MNNNDYSYQSEDRSTQKSKVISGLSWKFAERIVTQVIAFLVQIVLARILLPEHYGRIAIVTVFIAIANVFVTAGLSTALVQKKDADNLDFSSIFYGNILFSLVLYCLLFFAAPLISSFYNIPELSPVLRVLALQIPISALHSVQQAFVSRRMDFKRYFWSSLFGTLVSGVVGIWMAYEGFGLWAIVAQHLTDLFIDTVVLWFTAKWRPVLKFSFSRWKVLASYGWKIMLSTLIDNIYTQLRSLLIGKFYTESDLAHYNKGQTFPQLVVTNVNLSISSVLFPAVSRAQNDKDRVKAITRRSIRVSSYIIWPLMAGLAAVSTPLIRLMLTEKWLFCVPYLQIACFTFGLMPIHTANLEAIKAVGRSDLFLRLEIIKKLVGVAAIAMSLPFGVMPLALSSIIVSLLSSFINAYPNRKLLDYSYFEQLKDILPGFAASVVMAIPVYLLQYLKLNDWFTLALQVVSGLLLYVLISIVFRMDSFRYILTSVREFIAAHHKTKQN